MLHILLHFSKSYLWKKKNVALPFLAEKNSTKFWLPLSLLRFFSLSFEFSYVFFSSFFFFFKSNFVEKILNSHLNGLRVTPWISFEFFTCADENWSHDDFISFNRWHFIYDQNKESFYYLLFFFWSNVIFIFYF